MRISYWSSDVCSSDPDKKLPILEDVRDESAEDLRIVLEPKSRNVDPDVLKESLFRLTDLESRFALNLNVLDATRTPKVMGLKQLLTEWLQHQKIGRAPV